MKLDYEYTETNLSFAALKGTDKHYFKQLCAARFPCGDKLELHLVLATKSQTGLHLFYFFLAFFNATNN